MDGVGGSCGRWFVGYGLRSKSFLKCILVCGWLGRMVGMGVASDGRMGC